MATIMLNLADTDNINDVIKTLSIRHKALSYDESMQVSGVVCDKSFIFYFRNYYKQRYIVFSDEIGIVTFEPISHITGHEFIAFIKKCLNVMIERDTGINHYTQFI